MADPTSLFIGQLCPSTNEKDLEACFDKYGPVVKGNFILKLSFGIYCRVS